MRLLLTLCLYATGCAAVPFLSTKTASPDGEPNGMLLHRHVVRYQLIGQTVAESCGSLEQIKASDVKSTDPRAFGSPLLYEMAKYNAIGKIPDADGLVGIHVKVEYKNGDECVTVTGRAYKIISIMATPYLPNSAAPLESVQ